MHTTPFVRSYRMLTVFAMFIAMLSATRVFSQITINKEHILSMMSAGGHHFVTSPLQNVTSVNIGKTGGPNVYDFNGISFAPMQATNNYLVDSIPVLAVRFPSGGITFGNTPGSIEGGPIMLFTNDTMYQAGRATLVSQYRFRHYEPYGVIMPFPLTYLQTFTRFSNYCDTTYDASWHVTNAFVDTQLTTCLVDGYGTLKIFGHEAECLRLKIDYPRWNDVELMYVTREGILVDINLSNSPPDTGIVTLGDLGVMTAQDLTLTGVATNDVVPKEYFLNQNFPNPFNPSTTISFSIGTYSNTSLRVYDVLGREVAIIFSGKLSAGNYTKQWNAQNFPSGVYFYRLQVYPDIVGAGSFTQTKKLVLMK